MKKLQDTRLNDIESRQFGGMKFVVKQLGEASYESAMYDRPKYWMHDSPVAHGYGKNIHEAKIDAFLTWSRK